MKIRCSQCGTEYQMDEALLEQAEFRVACSQCHRLFRAAVPDAPPAAETTDLDPELDDLLAEMEETLAGLERLEQERAASRPPLPAALDSDIPPEMLALQAREVPPELLLGSAKPARRASAGSYFLAALLTLLLLAQLAWINREALLAKPGFRALAEQLCPYVGCSLPSPPSQPRFRLVDRRFEATGPRSYRLRLLLENASATHQPPPAIQVTFTDSQQRLIARRTFDAPVYLHGANRQAERLAPGQTLEVELNLAVPAGPVSGYEIEFIPAGA